MLPNRTFAKPSRTARVVNNNNRWTDTLYTQENVKDKSGRTPEQVARGYLYHDREAVEDMRILAAELGDVWDDPRLPGSVYAAVMERGE